MGDCDRIGECDSGREEGGVHIQKAAPEKRVLRGEYGEEREMESEEERDTKSEKERGRRKKKMMTASLRLQLIRIQEFNI